MNPVLVGWLEPREYEEESPMFFWVEHLSPGDVPAHWVPVYTDGEAPRL